MDTGTTVLTDLQAQLGATAGDAYLKAILCRRTTGWDLFHGWALIGAEPRGWAEQEWRYEQVAFVACVLPACRRPGRPGRDGRRRDHARRPARERAWCDRAGELD
jgi:hypothetical protein